MQLFFWLFMLIFLPSSLLEKVLVLKKENKSLGEFINDQIENFQENLTQTINLTENVQGELKKINLFRLNSTIEHKKRLKILNSNRENKLKILSDSFNLSEENNKPGEVSDDNNYDKKYEDLLKKYLENRNTEELIQISTFYDRVEGKTYKGKWFSQSNIPFYRSYFNSGQIDLKFEKLNEFNRFITHSTSYYLRIMKGEFLDDWILFQGVSLTFNNITFKENTLNANYPTTLEFGQIFEKKQHFSFCDGSFKLNWNISDPAKINNDLLYKINNKNPNEYRLKYINGTFQSICGFEIQFQVFLVDENKDYDKIFNYCIILVLFCLLQILNTLYLIKKIEQSNSFANAFCLLTVGQNIIWNSYGCLLHFFLSVNYDTYSHEFGLISLSYFFNFSLFELKLLYSIWKIKNIRFFTETSILRRKLLRFYIAFYISIFISLFFVMKFIFQKEYILLAVFFTWIPQISYNILMKNRQSMPLINIFFYSLNKIFLQLYYRGCPSNIFQVSYDINFCVFMILIQFFFLLILYSQTLFGPRWFLPKRYRLQERNFYRTKPEVLLDNPNADQIECVICLQSLIQNDSLVNISDDFLKLNSFSERNQIKFKQIYQNCIFYLLEFHSKTINTNKKPYMKTPCKHFFHSECLESWFKQKMECPSCRQEVLFYREI